MTSVKQIVRKMRGNKGISLLEVTFAMAVLSFVMAGAAKGLVTYHEHMELQRQRAAALESCRTVLSQMRTIRDANANITDFPDAIVAVFPDGGDVAGFNALTSQQVVVNYTDLNTNPLEVTVTCSWDDLRGRGINFNMTSLLTDR